jgi:hypothetical protein
MKPQVCPEEFAVSRAGRTGQWNDLLRDHAAHCATCREVLLATRWMGSLAQVSDASDRLPDAERTWCAALLAQKQAEVERAQRPLLVAEALIVLLGLGALGWLSWHALETGLWLTEWLARGLLPPWAASVGAAPVRPALSGALAALILVIASWLVAHPLLGED